MIAKPSFTIILRHLRISLTCFLLPQVEFSADKHAGFENTNESGEHRPFDEYDDDHIEEEWIPKEPMIKFKDLEDEDGSDRETAFVRQKTPHPKELKAKAHKLFGNKKDISGQNMHHELDNHQTSSAGVDSEVHFFENGNTPSISNIKNGDLHHQVEEHHVQQLERIPTPTNQQQQMHPHHLQQLEQLERHFEENNDLDENEEGYKSLLRRELQAEFDRRQLNDPFFDQNRDKILSDKIVEQQVVELNRVSLELTEAVPPTETLNVEAQKARAELARQGSLADRNPPAVLAQVRAKQQHLNFEPDVTYEDGAPVLDILDLNSSPDREQGVRFLVCEGDEEDGPYRDEPEKQRLHRRDTPHHLKNKRIHQQVDKDKVASIIALALRKQEGTSPVNSNSGIPPSQEWSNDLSHEADRRSKGSLSITGSFTGIDEMRRPGLPVESFDIRFERADKGLGLSIAGGLGSTPYKDNDEGIFISRVTAGGPAAIAGLRKDDKVLSVNGHSCVSIDHYEAVGILKAAGNRIHMQIEREIGGPSVPAQNGHLASTSSLKRAPIDSITTPDSISLSSLSHGESIHSQKSMPAKSPHMSPVYSVDNNTAGEKLETIHATLMRDPMGLGFSIAGGKGAEPYIEGSESVFISKIAEGGPASRDGKIHVGDRLIQINGVDVRDAEHVQVVELLTGSERFVRLSVERKIISPTSSTFPSDFGLPPTPPSASGLESGKGVSPKVFGLPKPYTGLYSASSYMANRPSYMRTREPGQYTLNTSTGSTSSTKETAAGAPVSVSASKNTGSLGRLPGVSGILAAGNEVATKPGNGVATLHPATSTPEVSELISKLPMAPTKLGVTTECVKKTTFTETAKLKKELVNDIYGQYEAVFPGDEEKGLYSLKANVILPATEKHIAKFTESATYVINETPQLYQFVTLPFIDGERFTIDWIYNILDHKKESERIVYEDPDPETGFIILPDFKWSGKQMEDLYLTGIVHCKSIKSIRSLRKQHLPLLKKLFKDGIDAIEARYGVSRSQIRAYFHYQPSYYHLHVHYTHVQYNAPGISADRAHLLPIVIDNIEQHPNYYSKALLSFNLKESSNLFLAYKKAGYRFDCSSTGQSDFLIPLEFFRQLGRAKHEPCGEHWNVSYGDSAWRMSIAALCLKSQHDKICIAKIALSSAFTCLGHSTDQYSEWVGKMSEVRECMAKILPFEKAAKLYYLYFQHVCCRRKACVTTDCHKVYRLIMELEEALLLFEELQKEGADTSEMQQLLVKKISEIPFEGVEGNYDLVSRTENAVALLKFFLQISSLLLLKRTGWIRSKVRDPERVAGHMFRMGIMALLFEEENEDFRGDATNSAMVISLVHDMAESIVGDITPSDDVTPEEKHRLEVEAMSSLVDSLAHPLADFLKKAFNRYELAHPDDKAALLTKDLDKFDMVVQAFEYEEKEKRFGDLEDFFKSTSRPDLFKNPTIKMWDTELRIFRKGKVMDKQNVIATDNGES